MLGTLQKHFAPIFLGQKIFIDEVLISLRFVEIKLFCRAKHLMVGEHS